MKKIIAILLSLTVILSVLSLAGCEKTKETSTPQSTNSQKVESETESEPETESQTESEPETQSEQNAEQEAKAVPKVQKFSLTSLDKTDVTTTESSINLTGSSDLSVPLLLNGKAVERLDNGGFIINKELDIGKNTFTFTYGNEKYTYIVRYRYVIVESYSPKSKQTFESGSTFSVNVRARAGSTVTATFNGKTVTLVKEAPADSDIAESDFVDFIGSFELPKGNVTAKSFGKVRFVAKYKNASETHSSEDIICKRDDNVKYIAEVVYDFAETFDGATADDNSNPRNNYLPKGTVDYCDSALVYYKQGTSSEQQYYKLECGRRIYAKSGISKRYEGLLPDHNELEVKSVARVGNHTNITLKSLYKAPFKLDLFPQIYTNESPTARNYTIKEATYGYVQIIFCYATKFKGNIEFTDSDVFSNAEIIPSGNETVVKLYLKKKGVFYGWDSKYDSNGNLVLSFLEPAKITAANNEYGVSLKGVTILVDAGHGGTESGSYGVAHMTHEKKYKNDFPYEKVFNLSLANKVKALLQNLGATVIMTRTTDTNVSHDARCKKLHDTAPDYCISIHHNGVEEKDWTNTTHSGFGAYHSTPFSSMPAELVRQRTIDSGVYSKCMALKWHVFYLARMTACPVVLTENGFMTSSDDYYNTIATTVTKDGKTYDIVNEATNNQKAKAIVLGIVDYFKAIQPEE